MGNSQHILSVLESEFGPRDSISELLDWTFGIWESIFNPLGVFCVNFRQLRFNCEPLGVNDLLWWSVLNLWECFLGLYELILTCGSRFWVSFGSSFKSIGTLRAILIFRFLINCMSVSETSKN